RDFARQPGLAERARGDPIDPVLRREARAGFRRRTVGDAAGLGDDDAPPHARPRPALAVAVRNAGSRSRPRAVRAALLGAVSRRTRIERAPFGLAARQPAGAAGDAPLPAVVCAAVSLGCRAARR